MNILQILPELKVGGVERGVVDLARYLIEKGHKVVVVSGGGKLVKEFDMMGAKHYKLPVGRKNIVTMIQMAPRLTGIIKNENIDIVHARSRVPAWIAFFVCKFTHTKFITTAHGYYKNRFTSQVMGWGRSVIAASNIIARHMIDDFGVPHDRIRLIPRGVNLDQFKFKPHSEKLDDLIDGDGFIEHDDYVVGMIARMTPMKGHAYFIRAMSIVSRVIPKLKILIVGDSSSGRRKYKEELEVLVRRLGLDRIVKFTGQKSDIPAILSNMDLLVLPSVGPEAFGRVIIEAQASGTPVIAARVGGIVDIIQDSLNGLLVAPEDHHALGKAIIKIAKDKPLAQNLAEKARGIVQEKFSLEKMAEDTLALYEEIKGRLNILVIKISALGDVILSIPSLRAIRSRFPKANIKVLVGRESRQILKNCSYIDGVIVCDLKAKDRPLGNILKLASTLRNSLFDIVIDLQNSKISHLLSFLSLAPKRYGYRNGKWSFLLNHTVEEIQESLDPISHQFRTLRKAGINSENKKLALWPSSEDEEWADKFLEDNWLDLERHILIGLNAGGSSRWSTKRWGSENFAKLCDELAKRFNARVVLIGAKNELPLARELSSITRSKPVIAAGKTDLLKLATLLKRCRLLITSDSAPMHIAAAVDIPYVALFGPTDPARHVAPNTRCAVIKKEMKCSPCYKPNCGKRLTCMKKITVDDIVEAVEKHLQ